MNNERNQTGFGRVVSDVVDLCELQMQLLAVDGKVAKSRGIKAAIFLILAAIVTITAVMTAMIGAGFMLHDQYELSVGQALLIVSGCAICLAVICALIGARLIGKANESLSEAKSEFAENVRWIKGVILKPDQSPRNQIRREDFSPVPR